ncbi:hypothetical protein [Alteribacter natronophilus]|uniref:hypothetical protein n=1 Tax=Alteribacter natronophilus TaxID=2583810 RepID=UPI003F66B190
MYAVYRRTRHPIISQKMMVILNRTTNYILTKMTKEGRDYYAVLKESLDPGYDEQRSASTPSIRAKL